MHDLSHIEVPDEDTLNKALSKTKAQLFLINKGAGFLGTLLCNHEYVWDWSCPTAWCNGTKIGFNPRFFWALRPEGRLTLLVHELWHTGYDHMSRMGNKRCPDIWNIAADHVINIQMEDWGFKFDDLRRIGAEPCLDRQYAGMTTEQIYELLEKQYGVPMPQPAPGDNPGNGSPAPSGAPGAPPSPQQGAQGQSPQTGLGGDLRAPATPDEAAQIKGNLIKAVQASKLAKEAGVIPGEVELVLEEFLDPVLPWEVLLARFYTELSQDDYSWRRPSRRNQDEYLPSPDGDNRLEHLAYYMDVSGSVTDDQVMRFFSEVKFIHEDIRPKKVSMITFDTKIQDEIELGEDDPFKKVVIHGRGGTSLSPVYHHIKANRPTAAVIFSDLYCHPMETNPGVPVLWVVIDNKSAKTCFGKTIHIKA